MILVWLLRRREEDYFLCLFPWLVFFVTLAVRVHYVNQPHNWWLVHPDEIFQSLEVAHSEQYGYGFRPYEFMAPEDGANATIARQVELRHGLYALRSFLVPQAYATVTWFLRVLGFNFPPFVVWKTAHAVVASTLPLVVYRYVTAVFRSHDTASLAAIFVASCMTLHVFGTHTLLNSLLAPPVFAALTHLHAIVAPPSNTRSDVTAGNNCARSRREADPADDTYDVGRPGSRVQQTSKSKERAATTTTAAFSKIPSQRNSRQRHDRGVRPILQDVLDPDKDTPPSSGTRTVVEGQTTRSNSAHDSGMLQAFPAPHLLSYQRSFTAGAVLGLCCYVRTDVVALGLAVLLPHWRPFSTQYQYVVSGMFGALCGAGVGLLDDFRCYGWGIASPLNWFTFNVQKDLSAVIFGENSPRRYVEGIFFQNAGIASLCAVSVVGTLLTSFKVNKAPKTGTRGPDRSSFLDFGPFLRTTTAWLTLLLLYSCKGHKELRFVHNVIVLMLISCASAVHSTLLTLRFSRTKSALLLKVTLALFVYSQWRDVAGLTSSSKPSGNKMAFLRYPDIQDVNICLRYVASRPDVRGLFVDKDLYVTGGYTLLRKNVSIFGFCNKNFLEFSMASRRTLPSRLWFGAQRHVSVAYFGHVSNYVSVPNSHYVMKFVLEDRRYNYIVVHKSHGIRYFGPAVFQYGSYEVASTFVGNDFSSLHNDGSWKVTCRWATSRRLRTIQTLSIQVLKRGDDPATQAYLSQVAETITPVHNATVLEHEGDVLVHHGAWARAAERFRAALRVQPDRVSLYGPLVVCYRHLGEEGRSQTVLAECWRRFGAEACQATRGIRPL